MNLNTAHVRLETLAKLLVALHGAFEAGHDHYESDVTLFPSDATRDAAALRLIDLTRYAISETERQFSTALLDSVNSDDAVAAAVRIEETIIADVSATPSVPEVVAPVSEPSSIASVGTVSVTREG